MPYFALGGVFAIVGSLSFRRGGVRLLAVPTIATALLILGAGLWQDSTTANNETEIGVPILLALLSPTLTAAAIVWLGKRSSHRVGQWIIAMIVWALALLLTGLVALPLNWITF